MNEFTAEIVNRSFNEGIRAAAEAVRLSAGNFALMELVRRDPVSGVAGHQPDLFAGVAA